MTKYKKPPSKIRYEQNHPTVSFRLDLKTKERLKNALEGQSFASFIKEALGIKGKEIKSLEGAYKKGFEDGRTKGFNECSEDQAALLQEATRQGSEKGYTKAQKEFRVTYNCDVCGEPISITSENAKNAAKEYMEEYKWGHIDCHEKAKQR